MRKKNNKKEDTGYSFVVTPKANMQGLSTGTKKHKLSAKSRRIITIAVIILVIVAAVVIAVLSVKASRAKAEKETTTVKTTTTVAATTTTAAITTTTAAATTTTKATTVTVSNSLFNTDSSYASSHKYCIAVNRALNCITIYGKDSDNNYTKAVKAMVCSCGKSGHETPLGTFTTSDKYEWLKMVDGTYGQYTTRFNGAYWFHSVPYFTKSKSNLEYEEYNKLGNAASLGCVRVSCGDAKWLYDNIDWHTVVVVYDNSNSPGPLGKPTPITIDTNSSNRGWDPTDPDASNPWNA